ncbi:MAG: V-type ATP synthase subunit F [Actinomycetota bacterium]|nr:V-type ATP synthase subunit F [Actinomycetota bacterium]
MTARGVIAVVPPELETGFRLAGVETVAAGTAQEAVEGLEGLLAEETHGVIAVYEPFLDRASPASRATFEASLSPVVVPLPAGLEAHDEESHRVRISAMLSRAVGYHITFGEEISR